MPDLVTTVGSATANALGTGSRPWRVMPRIHLTCEQCGNGFSRLPSQHSAKGAFCGRECYAASMLGKPVYGKGVERYARICMNCGDIVSRIKSQFYRTFCSLKCSGEYRSGIFSSLWRGGITPYRIALCNQPEYKAWRTAVRIRDRGRCRWCDSEGVRNYTRLETHHIVPISAAWEHATDVSNGVTLCRAHHKSINGRESEYADFLAALINTPLVAPARDGVKNRQAFRVTRETLDTLYTAHRRSTPTIGMMFGVTGACVLKSLHRHGIPVRSVRDASLARFEVAA